MIQYAAIVVMLLGIYGLIVHKNVIKMIISLNVMEIGLNIFIVSIGFVTDGVAPILSSTNASNALLFVDPVPQALVLTAIVIGVGTTALGLALAKAMHAKYHTFDFNEMRDAE